MRDTRVFCLSPLAAMLFAGLSSVLAGQKVAAYEPAYLEVYVPANARLTIDNVKTRQTGPVRRFESPPLVPGQGYTYHLKAVWTERGKEIASEKDVRVVAGRETKVEFQLGNHPFYPEASLFIGPRQFVSELEHVKHLIPPATRIAHAHGGPRHRLPFGVQRAAGNDTGGFQPHRHRS